MEGLKRTLQTDYTLKVILPPQRAENYTCLSFKFIRNSLPINDLSTIFTVNQILGLDICADTLVGDAMRRGISGGQKKRLTTGGVKN